MRLPGRPATGSGARLVADVFGGRAARSGVARRSAAAVAAEPSRRQPVATSPRAYDGRSRRLRPPRGGYALHGRLGGLPDAALPDRGPGGDPGGHAGGTPAPSRVGEPDWALRHLPGAAHEPMGNPFVPRIAGTGAGIDARRVRPPE